MTVGVDRSRNAAVAQQIQITMRPLTFSDASPKNQAPIPLPHAPGARSPSRATGLVSHWPLAVIILGMIFTPVWICILVRLLIQLVGYLF
jgi:hypothetical protein